jgi:peptidoglycan hydrolase-like protein with peptidoglycan-binding domain
MKGKTMTTKKKTASRTTENAKKKTGRAAKSAVAVADSPATVTVTMAPEAPGEAPNTTAPVEACAQETANPQVAEKDKGEAAPKPVITIGMFQRCLSEKGFYDGAWDGHYGPYTKLWVARFQAAHNLPVDGEPTAETLQALGLQ